jgi:hypothetical protein
MEIPTLSQKARKDGAPGKWKNGLLLLIAGSTSAILITWTSTACRIH